MRVLLVGNYEFDGSTSMKIWSHTLLRELLQLGIDAKLITPKPILGRLKPASSGFGKWLGYCDRFLIFPRSLRAAASQADVVHICDHGGAMYALRLRGKPVLVTCHDMLAVRGALGELPDMKPSLFGRYLQRWIRHGVRAAGLVACVSHFTFEDVRRILKGDGNLRIVRNALNYPFQQISAAEAHARLAGLGGIDRPFILHVGSSQKRKNRDGVLRVFALAARDLDLKLVLAGEPLSQVQVKLARDLNVEDRVVQIVKPDVQIVEALYNCALALLFPSRYEGFGWPSIEAQACGCPVVASDIPPLVEAVGQSAMLHSLDDEEGMAASIRRLATDSAYREQMRQCGLENVRSGFQTARMMEQYLSLYRELACQR
jgi:glycosyltransferase involved in cell wall biosynthesis